MLDALSPHFWVEDIHASIAFYRDVLGFAVQQAHPAESPTFAALTRGEASIMLSPFDESFDGWAMVPEAEKRRSQNGPFAFYIEAGDIEAEFARAEAAGVVVDRLSPRPWGQQEFVVADPDGFWWAIWKAL